MAAKELTRNYPMSDADLKQRADEAVIAIKRDSADFVKRNVREATVSTFQIVITNFDDLPTDEELEGGVMDATLNKDTMAERIRRAIRVIRNMADLQYDGKGKYNSFGFADMANMSDNELYRLAKKVVRVSTTLSGELENQGFTEDQITELGGFATDFDDLIDAQHKAIEDRNLATHDRITAGNKVWAELVRLCSIGKNLYEDSNEAKYNDYVLTESSSPAAPGNQPE